MRPRPARRTIPFGRDEALAVRTFAQMPYVSEGDVAGVLGMETPRTREAIRRLSALDFIEELRCGSEWRYALTDRGIRRMAEISVASKTNISLAEIIRLNSVSQEAVDDILARYPVSLQWRRSILKRMGALVTFYRLTALAAQASESQVWFSWRRTDWLDGTIMLGDGLRIRVMRIGSTLRRRSLLYRLGSMVESSKAGEVNAVIVIVPGPAERRTVERWTVDKAWGVRLFIALEEEILEDAGQPLRLLRPIRGEKSVLLIDDFTLVARRAEWTLDEIIPTLSTKRSQESLDLDSEESSRRATLPGNGTLGRRDAELLSWVQLDARSMSALRIVSDWPLGLRLRLVELGASSRALSSLNKLGLVYYAWEGRYARCVLSDVGGRYLTAVDRTALGEWRDRWSVSVVEGGDGYKVSGGDLRPGARLSAEGGSLRSAETLIRHQDQVLEICATLGRGWRGAEVIEILPTHRSERWGKFGRHMRAIMPDAVITVQGADGRETGLSIEYEQRATGPVMMEQKLSPYHTYYRNARRFEKSYEETLKTLFVFPNEVHASRFGSHCLSNRAPWTRLLEVYVSSMPELRDGFEGDVWLAGGGSHMGERVSLEQIAAW